MSRALRVRCGVAKTLLEHAQDAEARKQVSRVQSAAILDTFQRSRDTITTEERTNLLEVITDIKFEQGDEQALLAAISPLAQPTPRRGSMQVFAPMIIDMFTAPELSALEGSGTPPQSKLELIMHKLFVLGARSPCELTTKLCTSLWICTTCEDPLRYGQKNLQHKLFKTEFKKFVRSAAKPLDKIERLPTSGAGLRERYPTTYAAAFKCDSPVACPNELRDLVSLVDASFKSRGTDVASASSGIACQGALQSNGFDSMSSPAFMQQMMMGSFMAMQAWQQQQQQHGGIQLISPSCRRDMPRAMGALLGRPPSENLRRAVTLNESLLDEYVHNAAPVPAAPLALRDAQDVDADSTPPLEVDRAPEAPLIKVMPTAFHEKQAAIVKQPKASPSVLDVFSALDQRNDEKKLKRKLATIEASETRRRLNAKTTPSLPSEMPVATPLKKACAGKKLTPEKPTECTADVRATMPSFCMEWTRSQALARTSSASSTMGIWRRSYIKETTASC